MRIWPLDPRLSHLQLVSTSAALELSLDDGVLVKLRAVMMEWRVFVPWHRSVGKQQLLGGDEGVQFKDQASVELDIMYAPHSQDHGE